MSITTIVPASSVKIDALELLSNAPVVSNAPLGYLLSYAEQVENKQLTASASSSNLDLRNGEKVVLELIAVGGNSTYHELDEYVKDGTLVNIERFLVDSGSILHLVRRRGKTPYYFVLHSYATNMNHQLSSIDTPLLLRVYDSKHSSMTTMVANRNEKIMTRLELLPNDSTSYSASYHFQNGYSTKQDNWLVGRKSEWHSVFEHIVGWKVSTDLKWIKIRLRIAPNSYFTLPNPWVQSKGKFDVSDLVDLGAKLVELYKLNKLIPRMLKKDQTLDWNLIRLTGVGHYFRNNEYGMNDDLVRAINKRYQELGLSKRYEAAWQVGGLEAIYTQWNK